MCFNVESGNDQYQGVKGCQDLEYLQGLQGELVDCQVAAQCNFRHLADPY